MSIDYVHCGRTQRHSDTTGDVVTLTADNPRHVLSSGPVIHTPPRPAYMAYAPMFRYPRTPELIVAYIDWQANSARAGGIGVTAQVAMQAIEYTLAQRALHGDVLASSWLYA